MNDQQPEFDIFLAHNSVDKPQVRTIAKELKHRGLNPWLDEEQIRPGSPFQDEIQKAILQVKSAAIFIGPLRIGKWQAFEIKAFVNQCIDKDLTVIPVLLPDVSGIPEELIFLKQLNWVAFTNGIDDYEALDNLEWGVTGQKPKLRLLSDLGQKEAQSDDLSSKCGVDYTRLRDLLEAGQWKEADWETLDVMLTVAGYVRSSAGRVPSTLLTDESIENFPCTDLRTIDQLWVKYSKGKFGFSVQKKIWQEVNEVFEDFGDCVDWRKSKIESSWFGRLQVNKKWLSYKELTFNLEEAPKGHLPVCGMRCLCVFPKPKTGFFVGLSYTICHVWTVLFSRRDL